MSKLPVIETVKSAFTLCYFNLSSLVRIAAIPAAIVFGALVLQVIVIFVIFGSMNLGITGMALLRWIVGIVFGVAVYAALTPMATVWHRFVLAVSEGKLPDTTLKWQRAEKTYFVHLLILAAAMFALQLFGVFATGGGALGAIFGLLSLIGLVALIFAVVRVCLIFPALAVEENTSFAKAFRQSRGVGWQLFAVLLLIGLAFGIGGGLVIVIVGLLFAVFGVMVVQIVAALISAAITLASFAVLVAGLSLAYREVTGYRWR